MLHRVLSQIPLELPFLIHRTNGLPLPASQPAAENLRRLASRYLNHPDSQVDLIRMEPGSAGRYKAAIVLKMADFL